jgi:hypothetical protein
MMQATPEDHKINQKLLEVQKLPGVQPPFSRKGFWSPKAFNFIASLPGDQGDALLRYFVGKFFPGLAGFIKAPFDPTPTGNE